MKITDHSEYILMSFMQHTIVSNIDDINDNTYKILDLIFDHVTCPEYHNGAEMVLIRIVLNYTYYSHCIWIYMTERLLKFGANPWKDDSVRKTPFEYAITNGKLDIAELYIKYINLVLNKPNEGFYANDIYHLIVSIDNNNYDAVEMLLPHIKDINKKFNDKTPLMFAYLKKPQNNEIIELLLENGARS